MRINTQARLTNTCHTQNLGLTLTEKSMFTILGQNSPPGDSTQMFPAECGSESVGRLINKDRKQLYSHSLIDSGVILEQTENTFTKVL